MSTPQVRRKDVLAPIAAAFEKAAPDGGGAEFVARYFRHVPLDELTSRTPDVYAGAAASHLELARHRLPGVANVRVYNPSTEVDGWCNARTVIQIVTDDMPFLVDSVTGALVNAGIDIHLIVHPQLVVSRDAVGELEQVVPARRQRQEEGQGRRRRAAGVVDAALDRPRERRGAPGAARAHRAHRARGRAPDRRGLAEDAQQVPRARRRARGHAAAGRRPRRDRARHPLPALDGRRPLHLPGLPRLHAAPAPPRASSSPP